MAKDLIYYFTKDNYKKVELGEVQSYFNMSFVIDGTKDSTKIIVKSFLDQKIEPNTIIYHQNTNSWWIVSHDKVERYTNESGYFYEHNLQLLGVIELFNSRDLTDCGFYQNNYTIEQFIKRLLKLSNLEMANDDRFSVFINDTDNVLDINTLIDYMKSYENYTLLSAINDLVDGYNCNIKLSFDTEIDNAKWGDNFEHLCELNLNIISKTGNPNRIHQESVFNSVRETKTMDKNSFGTTVVSNAENVVSTKSKTFPSVGTVKLTGTGYEITRSNAVIRLPSDISKVNWVKIFQPITIVVDGFTTSNKTYVFYTIDEFSMDNQLKNLANDIYEYINQTSSMPVEVISYADVERVIFNNKDNILAPIILGSQITLYSGWSYDPIPTNGRFIAPTNNPDFYFPVIYRRLSLTSDITLSLVLGEKTQRDNINRPQRCLYYERGSNIIQGFDDYGATGNTTSDFARINGYQYTELKNSSYNPTGTPSDPIYHYYWEYTFTGLSYSRTFKIGLSYLPFLNVADLSYKVNYVPMTNLKIKYDNSGNRNDIQLYNQNGKLTDGVALSKMLLSYSKQIENYNITKFGTFYSYSSVPKVGDIVIINNKRYIINNVSLDFYQNEDSGYYINGEFTLSNEVAVKSLMVNPNTNIRDYGIPQNNNVVRKQLYRDFYEFNYSKQNNSDNDWYMPIDKIVNFTNYYEQYKEHVAVIKLAFEQPYGGETSAGASDTWYYQLDTTTYFMKKTVYEVVNFNDNNIIGYGSQNVHSEFDITRIFTGMIDTKNTPISYVDDNGKVKDIYIAMTNVNDLAEIYQNYKVDKGYGNNTKSIINYSVFIPEEIYNGNQNATTPYYGASAYCDFKIEEENYYKDPLEVPFFEYSCQIDDSDEIVIGDNILETDYNDLVYLYSFVFVPKNKVSNNNYSYYVPKPYIEHDDDLDVDYIKVDNGISMRVYGVEPPTPPIPPTPAIPNIPIIPVVDTPTQLSSSEDVYYVNEILFYQNQKYNIDTNEVENGDEYHVLNNNILYNYDVLIIRHRIDKNYTTYEEDNETYVNSTDDLLFILRNTNNATGPAPATPNRVNLIINHYKLK